MAAAIGILVEDGLIRWDTLLHTILLRFKENHGEVGKMITIVDLLSHRSTVISPGTFLFQDYNEFSKGVKESKISITGHRKGCFEIPRSTPILVTLQLVSWLKSSRYGVWLLPEVQDHLERTTTMDVSNDPNFGKCHCVLENMEFYSVSPPRVSEREST